MCDIFIGTQVHVTTKSKSEFVGTLVTFDPETSVVLKDVKCFHYENSQEKLSTSGTIYTFLPMQTILTQEIVTMKIVGEVQASNTSSCPEPSTCQHSSAAVSSTHELSCKDVLMKSSEKQNDSQHLKPIDKKTHDPSTIDELRSGIICTVRLSINELFDATFDSILSSSSANSSIKSSSSKSSKTTSSDRPKRRPCMVWSTSPTIEVFVTSTFDKVDILNPSVKISPRLSNEYILKRLIPIYPKEPFGNKRCVVTKSATAKPAIYTDTYLILIPMTIKNREDLQRKAEYIGQDDFLYITNVMRQIQLEEMDEKVASNRRIDPLSILVTDDIDSSTSSLPIQRRFSIEDDCLSNDQRIFKWIEKNNNNPNTIESSPSSCLSFSLDLPVDPIKSDDDDKHEQTIFLINETGEELCIFHWDNPEVDQNKRLTSSSLITHEWISLVIGSSHRLQEKSPNTDSQCDPQQQQIHFQIRGVVKTIDLNKRCKRIFSIDSPSENNLPIQIVCDVQLRNNHIHVIFSSIGKIVNYTKMSLFVLQTNANSPNLYERKDKIDVNDEYYIPINLLHENFHKPILIGLDHIKEMNDYLSLEWQKEFPVEKTLQLTNGNQARLIVYKESHQTVVDDDQLDQICFSMSIYLSTDVN